MANTQMIDTSTDEPLMEGATLILNGELFKVPYTYTGWRDETIAAKETAFLGTGLMMSPIYDITGPDAADFLNSVCVNKFSQLKVGGIRHAVLCNDKGQIMTDGVIMRIDEELFRTYWLSPVIDYLVDTQSDGFDVQGATMTGTEYFLQLGGPLSYDILFEATGQDAALTDLAFAHHDVFTIAGHEVRILRLGMTGNLAYEMHGPITELHEVYTALWVAGEPHGLRKQGQRAYVMSHTEGGNPNILMHYPMPSYESEFGTYRGFSDYLASHPGFDALSGNKDRILAGSVGDELDVRFVTPYDVGWGNLVKFTHDFPGKEALQELADHPERQRRVVTLEWNAEDIADIYRSQFEGEDVEPYDLIEERPNDVYLEGPWTYHADWVQSGDQRVGISAVRGISAYYRRMISLGFIDPRFADLGTELTVLWGAPGHPQKAVRATVARYPYIDQAANRDAVVGGAPTK